MNKLEVENEIVFKKENENENGEWRDKMDCRERRKNHEKEERVERFAKPRLWKQRIKRGYSLKLRKVYLPSVGHYWKW